MKILLQLFKRVFGERFFEPRASAISFVPSRARKLLYPRCQFRRSFLCQFLQSD